MPFRVLATARSFCNTPGAHHDLLAAHDCAVDLRPPEHPLDAAALAAIIAPYDGVILGLDVCDESVLANAPYLRVVSRYGVGVDKVDIAAATRRGIVVTNTPGANNEGVAELAVCLMFALARDLPRVVTAARGGEWLRPTGWELAGRTLGIVGFGAIGRRVAQMAHGIGMRVSAYDPFWRGDTPFATLHADLTAVLGAADVVSLHAPLTAETDTLMNAERLAQMREGAYLVNTARGELVDEAALYDALASGRLGGAAADVFRSEPPVGSPLLTFANFIATPHIGATTRESVARMALSAAENVVRILHGQPCDYVINPEALNS